MFKVDLEQILGAAPSATNAMPARLTDGTSYYQGATQTTLAVVSTNTGNTATSAASIDSKTPALGQALMAASVPIAIASNQSAVPVSAASLPLPSGAATQATLAAFSAKSASAFINNPFDETVITYVSGGAADGQINTVVYKLATVTVNTVTMSYNGSGQLTGVVKS